MRELLKTTLRLLTFRLTLAELLALDRRHLWFGLAIAWLAGVGRYWDHPDAKLLQYLGVGSVAYVFVLSAFLWALIWPLRPANWSYTRVLTFVTLTAPPALLYAIPVERFMPLAAAQSANFWFLAVVALWRVALLLWFLHRVAGLGWFLSVIASLLPLALIVILLAALNLEQAVFEIMSGKPGGPGSTPTSHDIAYGVVALLAMLSFVLGPFLLGAYFLAVVDRWRTKGPARAEHGELSGNDQGHGDAR